MLHNDLLHPAAASDSDFGFGTRPPLGRKQLLAALFDYSAKVDIICQCFFKRYAGIDTAMFLDESHFVFVEGEF
ncbi:MAG: hypothetical protein NXI04_24220 [Planctomycetaceae bacterium]|nr:hypothetical protein [Planctomycetaceae bacterium]